MIKTAVIIAGGEGIRFKPLSDNKPKAMIEVHGQPMLFWIIQWLKSQSIKNLVLGVAYKKERIYDYMAQNKNFGMNVQFSEHTLEGGTAQGFKLAISRFVRDEVYLAMNCDEITNLSIPLLYEAHKAQNALATLAVTPFHCRFSTVNLEKDGVISGFKYGHILENVLVSIGIYIFNAKLVEYLPETGSIENLVFSKLAQEKKLGSYRLAAHEEWISVNDPKNVHEVEENLHILTRK